MLEAEPGRLFRVSYYSIHQNEEAFFGDKVDIAEHFVYVHYGVVGLVGAFPRESLIAIVTIPESAHPSNRSPHPDA